MAKKKQTSVKSKKKVRVHDEEDPAYKNRSTVQDDDNDEIDIEDDVDEVGFEREEKEDEDESF